MHLLSVLSLILPIIINFDFADAPYDDFTEYTHAVCAYAVTTIVFRVYHFHLLRTN